MKMFVRWRLFSGHRFVKGSVIRYNSSLLLAFILDTNLMFIVVIHMLLPVKFAVIP